MLQLEVRTGILEDMGEPTSADVHLAVLVLLEQSHDQFLLGSYEVLMTQKQETQCQAMGFVHQK